LYFKDIIGLEDVKAHLVDTVDRGIIPHARIFYGQEGVGKLPLAIAYARYINCENRMNGDSCGVCPSCQKFDKLAHPDLHFVFPVVKSKLSDDYIEEWRQMLSSDMYITLSDWLSYMGAENSQAHIYTKESDEISRKLNLKVYESLYKVMIIWLPEKMQMACANKLLKLIEEPYDNTLFLLVSEDKESVLQTIWSRCQPLHIKSIGDEALRSALMSRYDIAADEAAAIAHISRGSFTRAKDLIESSEHNSSQHDMFVNIMRSSVSGDIKKMKECASELASMGRESQKDFLSYSLRMFREYFVMNFNDDDTVYLNSEEKKFGRNFSSFINERNIEDFTEEFSEAYRQISQNGNSRIIFLDLCLKSAVLLKK
jgi:DNA polymerase-3 subunit delta'